MTVQDLEHEILHYTKETNLLAVEIKMHGFNQERLRRRDELLHKYMKCVIMANRLKKK